MKFEKIKWNQGSGISFPSPYRKLMIEDLLSNNKLVGLKYSELINILGFPDNYDSSSVVYNIIVDFGNDIDPIYSKYLDFSFSKDSTIIGFNIVEWKD